MIIRSWEETCQVSEVETDKICKVLSDKSGWWDAINSAGVAWNPLGDDRTGALL